MMGKHVFLGLTLASAGLVALVIFMFWKVMVPGLAQIHIALPMVWGAICLVAVLILAGSLGAILLATMGVSLPMLLYVAAWKVMNMLFPLAVGLGKLFNIRRFKVQQSFIALNNELVLCHPHKVPAERILLLTPHCIQFDKCPHKITRNAENCRQCGRCGVGLMLGLAHKYGCKFVVATGGTLARQMVKEARPKAIVAVACERDLTSGIQDVFPVPVLGVFNERPFGPCFNTQVSVTKLEEAILAFMEEDVNAKQN